MKPSVLANIVRELEDTLEGGVVSKVHQMDGRNIILKIFVRGREDRLLISAHPKFPRMHLTEAEFVNPPAPLRLCAFLRSRITNARIEDVEEVAGERIARIRLRKLLDGTYEDYTLVAELTGKSSNIILTDSDGVVLEALRHFDAKTSIRAVEPGVVLRDLPQPPTGMEEELDEIEKEPGMTWNRAADRHYSYILRQEAQELENNNLRRAMNDARKKVKRKIENLQGDLKKAHEEIDYYRLGDLLASNLNRLKRGMKEALVEDYSKVPAEKVSIRLDERLTPKENLEKYFKRAKKAKKAIELLKERIPETERELEYLDAMALTLEEAEKKEDLDLISAELIETGYMKEPPRVSFIKEEVPKAEPVRRFKSSDGFDILCGKSGSGNDLIVRRYGKEGDIWLHASGVPGSHVLIKTAGRAAVLTEKTLEEAASLAAWHSKAKESSKAEVIYTDIKNVKKPKGAKPGMVTVKEYRTILVKPGETLKGEANDGILR